MSDRPVARLSVSVGVPPERAFDMFVGDIGRWWKKDNTHWIDQDRAVEMRIEPRVGGRWLEVHDAATGEGVEIGRVTVYEPGRRIAFQWRLPFWPDGGDSDLELTFTPLGADGTRVDLVHDLSRSLLAPERLASYGTGWRSLLGYYQAHCAATAA